MYSTVCSLVASGRFLLFNISGVPILLLSPFQTVRCAFEKHDVGHTTFPHERHDECLRRIDNLKA